MDDSLAGSDLVSQAARQDAFQTFPIVPGRVYELRAALGRQSGGARGLGVATLRLDFADAQGRPVDPRIAGPDRQIPHLDPLRIETLPRCPGKDEVAFDAGIASRFFVAPPDAIEARLGVETLDGILYLDLTPLAIRWPTEGRKVEAELGRALASRERLLRRLFDHQDWQEEAFALIRDVPLAQIGAIAAQFARAGDWTAALAHCSAAEETAARGKRLARLRSEEASPPRLGFIGSARGHLRLSAHADLVLLREDSWQGQLAALDLDAILIESVPEAMTGDWALAFCSLAGEVPPRGAALLAEARDRDLPVRFLVTAEPGERGVWQGLAEAADAVVIEGDPARWTDPPRGAAFVRRATEPAAYPPLRQGAAESTMLVPVGSDVFQDPGFAALLNEGSLYDLLVTEFDYGFVDKALAERLPKLKNLRAVALQSPSQRTRLLQESTIVLLNGRTLRAPGQSAATVLDAIACGAIPVLAGPGDVGLDLALDRVWSAAELIELQRLSRIPWLRERRWRALWRAVCRHHVWTAADRTALLGRDPAAPDFDAPCVSAVMLAERPQQAEACLEAFRRQSWPEKELLLLCRGTLPASLPALGANERLFAVPADWQAEHCRALAIAEARGRCWTLFEASDSADTDRLETVCDVFRAGGRTHAFPAGRIGEGARHAAGPEPR